jgi:hypothetical protein
MPATFVRTCPLCGLRFSHPSLLELHVREDHPRREGRPARDDGKQADGKQADTKGPAGKAADG